MMERPDQSYVPALGFRWLTRFYDPVLSAVLKEEQLKRMLVDQLRLEPGQRVLDLGCGTATLTLMLKRAQPQAAIVGLDGDPEALDIGRRKVREAGVDLELRQGMAFDPPFDPRSFDRIVSSLMLHHLTSEQKGQTFDRALELLEPGGELHALDWGKAQNLLMRMAFLGVQLLDGFRTTADTVQGRLIPFMERSGFIQVQETHFAMSTFGTLSLYRAVKPAS